MTSRHCLHRTPSAVLLWRGRAIRTVLGSFLIRTFDLPISAFAGVETTKLVVHVANSTLSRPEHRKPEPQLVLEVQVGVLPSIHHFPGPMDF
jgi:hypothetical protein